MKRNAIAVTGLIVILVAVAAWLLGWFGPSKYNSDPKVAELEKLRDEAVARQPQMKETEQRAEREAFRERIQGLTEQQRNAFFESSAPIFVAMAAKRFETEYDSFMKLSPEEQRRELDKRIDQMEARGAGRGPGGGGPGAGGGRPGAGGGDRGGGGRGGPPQMTPEKRDEFRKKMLDWTTPEQRAKFENGMRMFNQRREERGLPPVGRPGMF